jgi:hypothetical protein
MALYSVRSTDCSVRCSTTTSCFAALHIASAGIARNRADKRPGAAEVDRPRECSVDDVLRIQNEDDVALPQLDMIHVERRPRQLTRRNDESEIEGLGRLQAQVGIPALN